LPNYIKNVNIQSLNELKGSLLSRRDTDPSDLLHVMQHIETISSQKELAEEVGFSVGKVNYVIKALLEKGYVKMENFVRSKNKRAYGYLLTKEGLNRKIELTEKYIEIKKQEYEALQNSLKSDKDKAQGIS